MRGTWIDRNSQDPDWRTSNPNPRRMTNFEPEFCPYCGTELATVEPEPGVELLYCEAEDRPVFHNPVPTAGVAVLDGDELLLVERAVGKTAGTWMVPGGHVEVGEEPHGAAARELEEETGLRVDPADLVLYRASAGEPKPDKHVIALEYAVPAGATDGDLRAATDARDAAFWTPEEFRASPETLRPNHASRFGTDDLDWLLSEVRAVLDGADR